MAINFPNNPNPNDTWTSGGKTWVYDGTTWKLNSTSATGIGYTDLSVVKPNPTASGSGDVTYNSSNGQFTYTPPVVGSTSFTGLSDTPGSLTAGKWLKVNVGGTALEWTDAPTGNDTNDYLNTASLSGNTLTLTRTGSQSLSNVTVDLSSLNSVPTSITVADESTDIECYPLFTKEATGDLEPKTGSNIKFNSASGQLEAGSFKKTGGTAAEFLKADGSIDTTTYLSSNPSYALNDLSNVDATTNLANGKILKYDLGSTTWVVADDNASGGGSASFTGLSDTPSAHSNDKWLKSNGSALIWTDAPTGNDTKYDLTGVATTSGFKVRLAGDTASGNTNDDVEFTPGGGISYTVSGNTCQISSLNSLSGLSDTTIASSPTDNYVLTYDSATSKWEPQPVPSGSTPTLNAVLGAGNTSALAATVGDFQCANLTVTGTTTTVNSNTVNIGDNILTLNSDEGGTPSQNAGLEIERGTSTNVSLRWNETSDKWQYTNDGSNYSDIGSGAAYTIEALASPGIQLLDDGNAGASNRVFFDGLGAISVDRKTGTTNTIEFSASTFGGTSVGLVPASTSGVTDKFLRSDGTWQDAGSTDTKYDLTGVATGSGFKIRLAGLTASGNTNDDIELTPGGGISYTVSGNTCQISSINSLSGLSDTDISSSPSNNQVLTWSSSALSGAGGWVSAAAQTGGGADGNNYATSLSFNTGNGILTLNRGGTSSLSSITVDLDGRYATGTIPTNNNQLTNGANYITSSGTITNSEKIRVRTDTGDARHNLVFVDSYSDNQFQVLKVDNADWSCCYNPNSNCLSAAALQSYHMRDWSNSSLGSWGQFLMSQASSGWKWSTHIHQELNGEIRISGPSGASTNLEGAHLQFEDSSGNTSYGIDVYRNSVGADIVMRFLDQSQNMERFSIGPQGQWGIGHVGGRSFGSLGQVMISRGPTLSPQWGNASGIAASVVGPDIDNIYAQLNDIGNDSSIITVQQIKAALAALTRPN